MFRYGGMSTTGGTASDTWMRGKEDGMYKLVPRGLQCAFDLKIRGC